MPNADNHEYLLRNSLFLAGATATGKSDIAVGMAERIGGEVVSADAFQVYAGLDLLTAKPSPEQMRRVPHHLVGTIPLDQTFNAAEWRDAALEAIASILARGVTPVVCGGTGLYFRALIEGFSELPSASPALREEFAALTLDQLLARLAALDPTAVIWIDTKNRRRVERALEVCLLTGRPFSESRRDASVRKIPGLRAVFLDRDRPELYARIDQRTAGMFEQGVVAEVAAIAPAEVGQTAEQMIGYKEIRQLLGGRMGLPTAIAQIQQATRRYAKRQLTWFKKDRNFTMLNVTPFETSDAVLQGVLAAAGYC